MFGGLDDLLKILKLVAQPLPGSVRLLLTVVIFYVLTSRDTGRLSVSDFTCHPENNDGSTEECFSTYSAEMSSFMHPQFFVFITAVVLLIFWSVMILYSYRQIEKIRRASATAITKLKNKFWGKVLLHVHFEAVFIIVSLGLFCCTQKIHVAETYDCIPRNAPMKILTCRDKHQQDKKDLNIYFIGGMISILLCCMWEICRAKKCEVYFKELVDLIVKSEAGYDGNQSSETPMHGVGSGRFAGASHQSGDERQAGYDGNQSSETPMHGVGSGRFAGASHQSGDERQVKRRKVEVKRVSKALKDLVNNHSDSWDEICCRLDTRVAGLGSYEDVGRHYGCDLFTMKSRFKTYPDGPSKALILYIITKQPDVTVEAFAKAVENHAGRNDVARLLREFDLKDDDGKRHRNTQSHSEKRVARVSDDIFQVIVDDFTIRENFLESLVFPLLFDEHYDRMIVRGLSEWIEDICIVMNSGELEERDKILDMLEQLPLSEALDQRITERAVIHRKRNTDIAKDRDESFQVSVSRRIVAIVDKWMEEIFSVMNSGEPGERDKILDVLEQLSLSKVLDQRITERAVVHRKRNTDIAQDRDEIFQVSVSRRIVAILVKWKEEIFSVMKSGELREIAKIVNLFGRLSELHDPRNTKRDVMHWKRNTDIAQDRDESFEGSVRRRIAAIVVRWLRVIFMLINRGGGEERDKILDMLEQLPLSEVLHQRITKGGYRL